MKLIGSKIHSDTWNLLSEAVESIDNKFAGRKQVGYCENCQIYLCERFNVENISCPNCQKAMTKLLKKVMDKGNLIVDLPTESEIRQYVKKQSEKFLVI